MIRVGVGANWLGDRYDTDFGLNLSLQANFFPARPWVISTAVDFGTLGDAEMMHASGTIGYMIDRCEVYGGYDYRQIGNVDLSGPKVGLRIWF